MFAESPSIDPTFIILILAVILLVFIGVVALAIYGIRIAYRAATGQAPMQRFYVVLAIEVLVTVGLGFGGGVLTVLGALALVIQLAIFVVVRRSRD